MAGFKVNKRLLVTLLAVLSNLALPVLSPMAMAAAEENTRYVQICTEHGIAIVAVDEEGREIPNRSLNHIDCLERCANLSHRNIVDLALVPELILWSPVTLALRHGQPSLILQDEKKPLVLTSTIGSRAPPATS